MYWTRAHWYKHSLYPVIYYAAWLEETKRQERVHHLIHTTHHPVSALNYSNENLSTGRMWQHPDFSLYKKFLKYALCVSSGGAKNVITIFCIKIRHVTSCPLHFVRNSYFQPVSIPQFTYIIATETSPYFKSGIPCYKYRKAAGACLCVS